MKDEILFATTYCLGLNEMLVATTLVSAFFPKLAMHTPPVHPCDAMMLEVNSVAISNVFIILFKIVSFLNTVLVLRIL